MTNQWQPDAVAKRILLPLAEALEKFVKKPPRPLEFILSHQKLERDIKEARNYLEYFKTPQHARAFADAVNDAIAQASRMTFPTLPTMLLRLFSNAVRDGQSEPETMQIYRKYEEELERYKQSHEYNISVDALADTAKYLRQLASMMIEEQSNKETDYRAIPVAQNLFAVEGETVHVRFAGQEVGAFTNRLGMRYLAYLVAHPKQTFESARDFRTAVLGNEDPKLGDRWLKADYSDGLQASSSYTIEYTKEDIETNLRTCNDRLKEIDRRLARLERLGDPDPLERKELEEEKQSINEEIKRLGGERKRRAELIPEVANLEKSIRQAVFKEIEVIRNAQNGAALAGHFDQTLKPFTFPLCYDPQPSICWNE